MGSWTSQTQLYFDANATHPLLPEVREALSKALQEDAEILSNPSSIHQSGQRAKELLAALREEISNLLGRADPDEVVFLSGATEALNSVILGFAQSTQDVGRRPLIISSTLEHSAILEPLESGGLEFLLVPVNAAGDLNIEILDEKLAQLEGGENRDALCLFQAANNETGSIFNFDEIVSVIQKHRMRLAPLQSFRERTNLLKRAPQRIFLAIDAAQALAKTEESFLRRLTLSSDYMALSAHKMGGPMGIGALWLKKTARLKPLILGGKQERRRRGGTHNMLGILGWHVALQSWKNKGIQYRAQMLEARQLLESELSKISGLSFHGNRAHDRLPNTINFHVSGVPEESLVLALDLQGIRVSSGSACNAGSLKPSRVLMAMGYSEEESLASVRASLPVGVSLEDVRFFASKLAELVDKIRASQAHCDQVLPKINEVSA